MNGMVPGQLHLVNDAQRPLFSTPDPSQERVTSLTPLPLLPTPPPSQASSSPTLSPFAVWDEVENAFPGSCLGDPAYLLFLFHALGGGVPNFLFTRARSPQPRWTEHGNKQPVNAAEAGLDQQLFDILSNQNRLEQALDRFQKTSANNEIWTVSLELQMKLSQTLTNQAKEKWAIKALKWICFTFPRNELWEGSPNYASLVRSLFPLLDRALQVVERTGMPHSLREEVSEALLAASKVGNIRTNALSTAAALISDRSPLHLQAEMALQRSILFRLGGDFNNSERVIHDFCCHCKDPNPGCLPKFYRQTQAAGLSKRLNALYGLLHRSHLENLVQCEKYELAMEEIDDWQCAQPPSPMELSILPSKTVTSCKVFRSQGFFKNARESLEMCLKFLDPRDPIRSQVLCQLADVYDDLRLPEMADKLLASEIEIGRKKATKTKAFRRFLVSAVDASMLQQRYDDANTVIEELERIFSKLNDLDVSDQLLHVRILVASARISQIRFQFREAIRKWEIALRHVYGYKSFEGEGFTYSAIHLSISLAFLEAGEHEEAEASFNRGKAILDRGVRDYWIPTFAMWVGHVLSKLQSMARWAS